ncbi:MAG: glycyl-radical enzyme activating protein [Asgard group archaeon]|nr:glycyl-radical enzyme activating protein [Asgard group archaeon]
MTISGIIFDIKRFAIHDGPGIRTTIFLKGCPLKCWWCQNPESHSRSIETITSEDNETEILGKEITVNEAIDELLKDQVFYEVSNGGVTFSGGEPLYQPEFLKELLLECKKQNLHTTIDTAGCVLREDFESIIDYVDLFLYDVKIIDNEKHLKYTNMQNTAILDNLKFLSDSNKNIIIRIPIIPGVNDSEDDLSKLGEFLKTINIQHIELLPYHKLGDRKYSKLKKLNRMRDIKEPSKVDMANIREYLKVLGLKVKIEESL